MAQGPDPNRHFETDRENTPEDQRAGGGLGDPASTRAGLSSWAIAALAVLFVAVLLFILF